MGWKKTTPEVAERFAALIPDDPVVEPRKMFGYPCAFAGGQMFFGVHEENTILRLPPEERARFLALPGASPFAPLGREMKEYVVVPPEVLQSPEFDAWLQCSLTYVKGLPPKAKKAPKPKGILKGR